MTECYHLVKDVGLSFSDVAQMTRYDRATFIKIHTDQNRQRFKEYQDNEPGHRNHD